MSVAVLVLRANTSVKETLIFLLRSSPCLSVSQVSNPIIFINNLITYIINDLKEHLYRHQMSVRLSLSEYLPESDAVGVHIATGLEGLVSEELRGHPGDRAQSLRLVMPRYLFFWGHIGLFLREMRGRIA